jgi:hypothetical protein
MKPIIVPATPRHAQLLACALRPADAMELARSTDMAPVAALEFAIAGSLQAWAWEVDGGVGALFGVCGEMIGAQARPWLLTTAAVLRHPRMFWHHSRAIVALMRKSYPLLVGYCDAEYAMSLRWLTRLGFQVDPPALVDGFPAPFCRFRMVT